MKTILAAAGSAALAFSLAACAGGGGGSTPHVDPTTNPMNTMALWIANGTNVLEFLPSQLTAGAIDPAPHLAINGFGAPQGVQFDSQGDLWVLDGGTVSSGGTAAPMLDEFTASALASHATVPSKTLTYPGIMFPQQGVFDASGDFWVTDCMANEIVEFTPAQLGAGGMQTPNRTITSTTAFNCPLGIAFSPVTGNLWVANNGGTSIEGFAASVVAALGTGAVSMTPHDVLNTTTSNSIQAPWALVFDKQGDMWSSNANAPFTIVEFGANTDLGGAGGPAPTPTITISPVNDGSNTTLAAPNGLAFDPLGDLAAASSATPFGAPVYSAAQLKSGGGLVPNVFLVGGATTLNAPAGNVFGPAVQ